MANEFSILTPGLPAFQARFKMYRAGLTVQTQRLERRIGEEIAETAAELVAYDTGETSRNIRVERWKKDTVVVSDRGGDRPEVAIYLEIGTFKMAARPYMRPAAELVMASNGLRRGAYEIGGLLPPV